MSLTLVALDPEQLETLAELVAERLAGQTRAGLVDARTVARYLAVEESYVYEHANDLGARRLGTGPKARLRFSLREVDERISCPGKQGVAAPEPALRVVSRRRRPTRASTGNVLLPIRGHATRETASENRASYRTLSPKVDGSSPITAQASRRGAPA